MGCVEEAYGMLLNGNRAVKVSHYRRAYAISAPHYAKLPNNLKLYVFIYWLQKKKAQPTSKHNKTLIEEIKKKKKRKK